MLTKIATVHELCRNSAEPEFGGTVLLLNFNALFTSRYGDGKECRNV